MLLMSQPSNNTFFSWYPRWKYIWWKHKGDTRKLIPRNTIKDTLNQIQRYRNSEVIMKELINTEQWLKSKFPVCISSFSYTTETIIFVLLIVQLNISDYLSFHICSLLMETSTLSWLCRNYDVLFKQKYTFLLPLRPDFLLRAPNKESPHTQHLSWLLSTSCYH